MEKHTAVRKAMRTVKSLLVEDIEQLKGQLLAWAQQFEDCVWLDSNAGSDPYGSFEAVLAVDAFTGIRTDADRAFDKLKEYQESTADWIFGYLSYDLKNATEALFSANVDGLGFPELYFFQPKKLFLLKGKVLELHYLRMLEEEIEEDLTSIFGTQRAGFLERGPVKMQPRIAKEAYLSKIQQVQAHIQRGDIYEANFCQEFYAEGVELDPLSVYHRLNSLSRPPFAAFARLDECYLFSASPERYLQKKENRLVSQPIKGTARRSPDPAEDARLAEALRSDPKERSENVMIVDLVRNDLSKTASKASVRVEELCGLYTFEQVHQLISTVSATLVEGLSGVEALKTSFPMGSMTGAPKIAAMQIMEELEESKRGLYSGALGYFTPDGDFDFNVVIRSILYNRSRKYLSFSVGGAITSQSVPEKEYEECLVKARAMLEALH